MLKQASYYIGLMSGTSLDGIDAALVEIDEERVRLLDFQTFELQDKLKEPILRLQAPGLDEIDALGMLDRALGWAFADAALQLMQQHHINIEQVIAIASHGQTIRHRPLGMHNSDPFTLQIGCAATIAQRTGITTVSDFRSRDMAAGGQGAPLVPFVHQRLFAQTDKNVAVVNIGGIANLTYLGADGLVQGFDTGPGNMLMDALMQSMTDARFAYDHNGELAATGQVNAALLAELFNNNFFAQQPPRSTGREDFGEDVLHQIMAKDICDADKMATANALTAQSILQSCDFLPEQPDVWLICGGGAHNQQLLQHLSGALAPVVVQTTDEVGLAADAVEAVAFAVLAAHTLQGKTNTLASVTGAVEDVCGGQITPGKNWQQVLKMLHGQG
ncbi:MAG: anhydro-N-acetylmuramic acid kinase [Mariprofundaceae bacterium]|nr:anhydro-N-acetylmuramic acid kinase [Mariprofundaceae bacterium]